MAHDWVFSTLGDLAKQGVISIQTGPFGSQLHSYDYVQHGTPVVPTEAIGRRRLRTGNLPRVAQETVERLSRHHLRPGDILFARRGVQATGLSALVEVAQEGWLCGTGAILLRIHKPLLDSTFLSFYLAQDTIIEWLKTHAVGAVMPNLNEGVLLGLPLLLPPPGDQRAIASILGTLDDKIELNRRMNDTLESMARALFQSWFVDFDPVRARMEGRQPFGMDAETAASFPCAFTDSPPGTIPIGWDVARLKDLAEIVMGSSPPGETYNDEGLGMPLINGPVEFGEYFAEKVKWTTAPTRTSRAGDLILCVRGSTTGRRVIADDEYCLGRGVCAIRAKAAWQPFVNQLVNHDLERLLSKITGSVFPNLSAPDINNLEVVRPSDAVINVYCSQVRPLVELVGANIGTNRTLTTLRDVLLPKLMSGEVRVRDAEKTVATTV